MARILLTNATIVTGASTKKGALAIDGERIAGIWHRGGSDLDDSAAVQAFPDSEIIDLDGKVLMAGGIDAHVHFREPGMERKADIGSESRLPCSAESHPSSICRTRSLRQPTWRLFKTS